MKPIRKHYPKASNGRHPIGLEIMLRIYFMQQWYGLSDPAMEDSLYDIASMRCFAGVDLERIPDESTILNFRRFLERHRLTEKLFRKTENTGGLYCAYERTPQNVRLRLKYLYAFAGLTLALISFRLLST